MSNGSINNHTQPEDTRETQRRQFDPGRDRISVPKEETEDQAD